VIINDVCYRNVKETLELLKSKLNDANANDGSLQHEIALREKDVSLYEAVVGGRAQLPDLDEFIRFPEKLILRRISQHISVETLASRCKHNYKLELEASEIIEYELSNYADAKYQTMLCIANALKEIGSANESSDLTSLKDNEDASKDIKDASLTCPEKFEEWTNKIRDLSLSKKTVSDSQLAELQNFSEALIMWRLAKKWSYKQLAEQADIDWLKLWFLEQNGYYGANFATMVQIATVVKDGEHEPSESSFDPDDITELADLGADLSYEERR
jgi:hypothetical protein